MKPTLPTVTLALLMFAAHHAHAAKACVIRLGGIPSWLDTQTWAYEPIEPPADLVQERHLDSGAGAIQAHGSRLYMRYTATDPATSDRVIISDANGWSSHDLPCKRGSGQALAVSPDNVEIYATCPGIIYAINTATSVQLTVGAPDDGTLFADANNLYLQDRTRLRIYDRTSLTLVRSMITSTRSATSDPHLTKGVGQDRGVYITHDGGTPDIAYMVRLDPDDWSLSDEMHIHDRDRPWKTVVDPFTGHPVTFHKYLYGGDINVATCPSVLPGLTSCGYGGLSVYDQQQGRYLYTTIMPQNTVPLGMEWDTARSELIVGEFYNTLQKGVIAVYNNRYERVREHDLGAASFVCDDHFLRQ